MKYRSKHDLDNRRFAIKVLLFVAIFTAFFVVATIIFRVKFPHVMQNMFTSKFQTPTFMLNHNFMTSKSEESKFTIEPERVGDTYYVTIRNLIANGATDPVSGRSSVFRISVTLEAANQLSSVALVDNYPALVEALRDVMSYVRPKDINSEKTLMAIKSNAKSNIEMKLGTGAVKDIYIEGLVGHE